MLKQLYFNAIGYKMQYKIIWICPSVLYSSLEEVRVIAAYVS